MIFDMVANLDDSLVDDDAIFLDTCASRMLLLLSDQKLFDSLEMGHRSVEMAEAGSKLTIAGHGLVGSTVALYCPKLRRNLMALGLLESRMLGFKALPGEPP